MEKIQIVVCALSPNKKNNTAFQLLLHSATPSDSEKTHLSINIGIFEAQAIIAGLENFKTDRPMTHDLLKTMIDKFNAKFIEAYIYDLQDSTFFAKIVLDNIEIEARPSDAIAVAVRFNAPIFINKDIWEESAVTEDRINTEPKNKGLIKENVLEQLKHQLSRAVEDENYEKAAALRDEISRIENEINEGNNNE